MPSDTPQTFHDAVELAKLYNPDMAFFLAIAPWPYADLYPQLEKHVAVKDYSQYNLVQPVVKPDAMTLEEVERELGRASRNFFMHKFQNLDELSDWKREFMLSVFDILINHSYLSNQMQDMAAAKRMPDEVKAMLKKVSAAKRDFRQGEARTFAPIP